MVTHHQRTGKKASKTLVNVGNAAVKKFKPSDLQMFFGEGNALHSFIRPQRYTQCILVRSSVCKYNLLLKRKPHGALVMVIAISDPLSSFCSLYQTNLTATLCCPSTSCPKPRWPYMEHHFTTSIVRKLWPRSTPTNARISWPGGDLPPTRTSYYQAGINWSMSS